MGVQLMGIVNLTDNSFLGSSRVDVSNPDAVLSRVRALLDAGADIIDVGACSTAPGNSPVEEKEEWRRLENALGAVFEAFPECAFSLDTFRADIVRKALRLKEECRNTGSLAVNDVRASLMDGGMLRTVADAPLRYIAMDSSGNPERFFREFALKASSCGVTDWIADPGFGFGKSIERNWEILHNLQNLKQFSRPVLAALSRKRMIYEPLGLSAETCASKSVEAELTAVSKGADIVRTHDVAALAARLNGNFANFAVLNERG